MDKGGIEAFRKRVPQSLEAFESEYVERQAVLLKWNFYTATGGIALSLYSMTYQPLIVVSCAIEGAPCGDDHMWIKDWSENAGVYQGLIEAGLIEPTDQYAETGFVRALLGKLVLVN